jgi:tape measure domain-containing protein
MALPAALTKTIEILFSAKLASDFAESFIDINTRIDALKRTLELVGGGAVAAEEKFEFLRKTAETLGLSIEPLGKSYAKLLEAVKGTNIEGSTTDRLFTGIAAAAAKLGLDSTSAERALKAIEQIASKGRVSLEEVRGQLGDAIPGAVPIFAEAAGVTVDKFFELVEAGKISSDVLKNVADILERRYGDGTEKVETLRATFGRLNTAVTLAATEIGEAGVNDAIQYIVDEASDDIFAFADAVDRLPRAFREFREDILNASWSDVFGAINDGFEAAIARLAKKDVPIAGVAVLIKGIFDNAFKGNELNIPISVDPNAISDLRRLDNEILASLDTTLYNVTQNAKLMGEAVSSANKAFQTLGSKERLDDVYKLGDALGEIAKNPQTNGEQFLNVFNTNLSKVIDSPDGIGKFAVAVKDAINEGKISIDQGMSAFTALGMASDGSLKAINLLQKGFVDLDEANKANSKGLEKKSEKIRDNTKSVVDYEKQLQQLASNERIKLIEARVALNIAQIKADAEIVIGIAKNIGSIFESTGDVIGSALGALGEVDGFYGLEKLELIEAQLERENEYRDRALELQEDLTQATIENLRAKTYAMTSGQALVKIDGAGLQPHLEAFMWEILKTIQVRVNNDGLDMLVGV